MAGLPEGWEADYDGARWFYRYKATEMVQYHFPQPGDEFAEFLADAGTGPFRLTPEERLAVEQESKRKNASNSADNTEIGARTNGGPSGKKKTEVFDDETPMSANGYFDPSSFMYFPGAHDDLSPLEDEESIRTPQISHPSVGGKGGLTINTSGSNVQVVAVELPEGERQIWSPVGHVAELATQETLRCAEELAPVELDGASLIIAPITTDMTQGLAELPTHRSPVEEKAIHVEPPRPQHVMQPVDSLPLVSASFAYPPLRADVNPGSSVSSNPSISKDTGASSTDPVDPRHGKHQQLQPGQVAGDERTSADGDGVGASTQTSVLQNQESELGIVAQNSPENDKVSIVGGKHDNSRPSTTLSELIAAQTSSPSHDVGSIPEALQPARPPAQAPVPLETSLQHSTQAKHDNTPASIGAHNLSHTPSVLRPGGSQPKPGLQEGEGNGPQNVSGQYTDDGMPSRPAFAQAVSLTHYGQAHITKVNTLPGRLPSTIPSPPKMNGSPGFLFFHEIPSAPNPPNQNSTPGPQIPSNSTPIPSTSYQTQNNLQSTLTADHQDAVVAPLGFVKPNSTTSSEPVSAAPETDDSSSHSGQPASPSSDQISEVISLIDNFTTSGTSIPSSQHHQSPDHAAQGGNNTPNPTSVTEGTGSQLQDGANIRPQPTNKLSSTLAEHTISTTADVSTSISVTPAPMAQTVVKPPPNDTGNRPTHGPTDTMTSQHPPVPNQGIPIQYQNPSPSPLPLTNSLSNVSTAPGKPESQGQPVNSTATITHGANNTQTNQFQSQPHRPSISYMNNSAQQQPQAQIVATNANKPVQTNGTTFIHQASHQPYGQSIASHPAVRPPTIGHHQTTSQSPNLQQPSATRPPSLPPQPHQQSSSMTHSVSPVPSQVSSPAQSIASLDVSTVSTPSTAFAAMNASMNSPSSHNSWSNAPARPPSVPAHAFAHQGGNLRPHANSNPIAPPATGAAQGLSSPTGSSPGKPFPMLPGQVIPLPSQIGSAPRPPLAQQPMANNHANVAATAQQTGNVVQPAQPISGGLSQHHGAPAQANPILNSPHGNVPYKPNPPPTQMKPPQQQTFTSQPGVTHNGMNNPLANQPRPPQQQQLQQQQQQQHQMVSYPSTAAPGQPQNQHMIPRPPVGRPPVTGHQPVSQPQMTQPQHLVQSPGFSSPVNAAQAKPFTSAQATAGLQEVGKGMKKWAKKMLKNPALKQTAVGFGGAVMAESIGVSGAAGAHLANSLYSSANRPPLNHAQTAPPQPHGNPATHLQHQSTQIGHQYQPSRPQPPPPQANQHPGHPQPGYPQAAQFQPRPPQPGHQQPGPMQPGQPQPVRPQSIQPQPPRPQPLQPQPLQSPTMQYPVGVQTPGRPPVIQNPSIAAGMAVNFNAQGQAQAQVGFNQQQPQYPAPQLAMSGRLPPHPPLPPPPPIGAPGAQVQAQVNVDANLAAAAATAIGQAVGAALRPEHTQPQHAQGYAQAEHTAHAEAHGAEQQHGYSVENHGVAHESAYGSSIPPPPAGPPPTSTGYADNSYATADTTTYVDNSGYYVDNNTYNNSSTETVNNTVYVDNSNTYVADTTAYGNTGYVDTTSYASTDITSTTNVEIDATIYTDGNTTMFSVDESINVASSSDFAVESTDYSGSGWGEVEF